MKQIVIWGAGRRSKRFIEENKIDKNSVLAFVDNNTEKKEYLGIKVYDPESFVKAGLTYDILFISVYDFYDIFFQCISLGVDRKNIAISRCLYGEPFEENYNNCKDVSIDIYNDEKKRGYAIVALNESDVIDEIRNEVTGRYWENEFLFDYFRFRTFELVSRQLQDVPGAVAELGVFKGVFSALINKCFSDRALYLYDTFQGFDEAEAEKEVLQGRATKAFVKGHMDGSENETLNRLLHPEKAVVRKGLFPDSVKESDKDEQFAFVSLDVDFEESTYQGLVFFYPRMSEGGMIFVHDYATYHLSGVRKAIERFEMDQGIRLCKIPLADRAGTMIIVKQNV